MTRSRDELLNEMKVMRQEIFGLKAQLNNATNAGQRLWDYCIANGLHPETITLNTKGHERS